MNNVLHISCKQKEQNKTKQNTHIEKKKETQTSLSAEFSEYAKFHENPLRNNVNKEP